MFRTIFTSAFTVSVSVFILFAAPHLSAQAQGVTLRDNPEISINGLFLATAATDGHKEGVHPSNGFSMQEVEFRFASNVDPYFRAEFVLAAHPEHRHTEHGHGHEDGDDNGPEDEHGGGLVLDLEEAFIETISLPGFSIRAGKFYAFLGRHNQLHTHYFPFIDAPITHTAILGDHGLNETGVALSYLTPLPWYTEMVFQAFSGENEKLFNAENPGSLAGVSFLRSLWDTGEASTLELNLGYGSGANSFDSTTELYNAAVTWKWRPVAQTIYRSFSWTTEFLQANRGGDHDLEKQSGVTTWFQYQFARRWWTQIRAEQLFATSHDDTDTTTRYSALLGLVPSEYSAIRLQLDQIHDSHHGDTEQRVSLQWNISIGAHPAHHY